MKEESFINESAENIQPATENNSPDKKQRGSAMVIALLIMSLLMVFVAIAMSRTTSETLVMANDASEGRTYAAASAALDVTTRNFNKIFDYQLSPTQADLDAIELKHPPGFTNDYEFRTEITQIENNEVSIIQTGKLQGLYAQRSRWNINTIAEEKNTGVEVQLIREYYNNLVPIFQFGIFYDDDLEFHPGPRFDFGGRVHSNRNIYLQAQTGLYFSSRVTAKGQVLTEKARNGSPWTDWSDKVYVRDSVGNYQQLRNNEGSALHNTVNGTNQCTNALPDDAPACYKNSNWADVIAPRFSGNLQSEQNALNLPLRSGGNTEADYIELIRRGRAANTLCNNAGTVAPCDNVDNAIFARERYTNKNGIRISLADSKAKLPGCASGVGTTAVLTPCGARLDGAKIEKNLPAAVKLLLLAQGNSPANTDIGYDPSSFEMTDGYKATRLNGNRFRNNRVLPSPPPIYPAPKNWENTTNEVWIKIELVSFNGANATVVARDVTVDILSLGVTEAAPEVTNPPIANFQIQGGYYNPGLTRRQDSRSIIELQRFAMRGPEIRAGSNFLDHRNWGGGNEYNYVLTDNTATCSNTASVNGDFIDRAAHRLPAKINGADACIVPFPIQMFDTREGLHNDSMNPLTVYTGGTVPLNGVMSVVQINVGNLRRFIAGEFNGSMPTNTPFTISNGNQSLRNTDVPQANGYVLYVSDRRGDADFDGEYDMEDIYGNNNGNRENGEDVNKNNALDTNYDGDTVAGVEAPKYVDIENPDAVAVLDHKYYRRAVRLVNGTQLPGFYDPVTPTNTRGFTVASENGVYVMGNYNATGVSVYGSPTLSTQYNPQNTAEHVPASVVGDAVMILSNQWAINGDARSFRFPFNLSSRPSLETTVRFAMISGDALSSFNATPNQGGGNPRMGGGVHNFKRFLEDWSNRNLNYTGSLINLYNARNNNGAFKCCTNTYSPPTRNWAFDTTFLDPARLPPGTPFIQSIQLTGFERIND